MDFLENSRYYMDETSAPYEQNKNPFPRAIADETFDKMIMEKYHLATKEMESMSDK